jgi:hypothetical protein
MAHPQNRRDTPELRLRHVPEFTPRQGTYPNCIVIQLVNIVLPTPFQGRAHQLVPRLRQHSNEGVADFSKWFQMPFSRFGHVAEGADEANYVAGFGWWNEEGLYGTDVVVADAPSRYFGVRLTEDLRRTSIRCRAQGRRRIDAP